MKTLKLTLLLSLLAFAALSCKKEDDSFKGEFTMNITVSAGTQAFAPFQQLTNHQDRKFLIEALKLLISDITFIHEDGTEELVHEGLMYDFVNNKVWKTDEEPSATANFKAPIGKFKGIKYSIGVPPSRNNANPASFPDKHPLHVNQGMNWSWATGYRFLIIEGRIDSSAAANGAAVDFGFAYHTGLNPLYRTVTLTGPTDGFEITDIQDGVLNLKFDLNKLFVNGTDVIDVVQNNVSHSTPEGSPDYMLSKKITDNLAERALYK